MLISILIPTLNASRTLSECLDQIRKQEFPAHEYEIIVADGGSTDDTIRIASQYGAKIVPNPLKTGEAGKMAALKQANGNLVVFLDSDNILIDQEWLHKMERPFSDPEIVATEPIRYDCRITDNAMTRYFAYLGMGDPLNYFLGNYDRVSALNNKWTKMHIQQEQKDGYIKVKLDSQKPMPTIGANGFAIRRSLLIPLQHKDYLFDVEILQSLGTFYIAKVDTGVVHLFAPNLSTFVRKQQRRIRDYVYYNAKKERKHSDEDTRNIFLRILYPGGTNFGGLIAFIFACMTIVPLILQAIKGFKNKRDWVWVLHPLICEVTFFTYAKERVRSIFVKKIYDRSQWRQ
jgi:glycosyltransferase involved in cell wall biosynthesis